MDDFGSIFKHNSANRESILCIADYLDVPIYVSDPTTYEVLYINPAVIQKVGNVIGKKCYEAFQRVNTPCPFCTNKYIFEENEGKTYIWEHHYKASKRWYRCIDKAIPWHDGRMVRLELTVDITERKLMEEELKYHIAFEKLITSISTRFINLDAGELDNEIYYALRLIGEFAEADRSYIILFDKSLSEIKYTYEWCSYGIEKKVHTLSGFNPNGISPWILHKLERFEDIYIPCVDALPDEASKAKECFKSLEVKSFIVVPMIHRNRLIGYLGFHFVKMGKTSFSDEIISLLRIAGEIFSNALIHKKYEKVLRKKRELIRRITDNMMDMICLTDTSGIIKYASPSHKIVLGYEPDDLIGKSLTNLLHQDDISWADTLFREIPEITFPMNVEFRYKRLDGTYLWLESSINPLFNENCSVEGTVFSMRDISERKQFEKEMARIDRMNLIGEMAAGIGHEIRNPMTSVRGFLQLLMSKKEYSNNKDYFQLMIDELDRANYIITEFLSLAKDKSVELKLMNLNEIISAILPLIQANAMESGRSVDISRGAIPDLLLDEKEIRQLLFNLVNNGLEAMDKGEITILTRMEENSVVLSVKDQGPGIAEEIIDKIGTPFFTTKESGTGLGLAVCYSIASRHKATIDVETSPNGTTFSVRFNADYLMSGHCLQGTKTFS